MSFRCLLIRTFEQVRCIPAQPASADLDAGKRSTFPTNIRGRVQAPQPWSSSGIAVVHPNARMERHQLSPVVRPSVSCLSPDPAAPRQPRRADGPPTPLPCPHQLSEHRPATFPEYRNRADRPQRQKRTAMVGMEHVHPVDLHLDPPALGIEDVDVWLPKDHK